MRRLAASLLAEKPTWVVQKRHARQVHYYYIIDPFEIKQTLQDVMKFCMHGYVKEFSYKLNPTKKPWHPEDIAWNKLIHTNNALREIK